MPVLIRRKRISKKLNTAEHEYMNTPFSPKCRVFYAIMAARFYTFKFKMCGGIMPRNTKTHVSNHSEYKNHNQLEDMNFAFVK